MIEFYYEEQPKSKKVDLILFSGGEIYNRPENYVDIQIYDDCNDKVVIYKREYSGIDCKKAFRFNKYSVVFIQCAFTDCKNLDALWLVDCNISFT